MVRIYFYRSVKTTGCSDPSLERLVFGDECSFDLICFFKFFLSVLRSFGDACFDPSIREFKISIKLVRK